MNRVPSCGQRSTGRQRKGKTRKALSKKSCFESPRSFLEILISDVFRYFLSKNETKPNVNTCATLGSQLPKPLGFNFRWFCILIALEDPRFAQPFQLIELTESQTKKRPRSLFTTITTRAEGPDRFTKLIQAPSVTFAMTAMLMTVAGTDQRF